MERSCPHLLKVGSRISQNEAYVVLPSPWNGEVSLAAEKKPVDSVAFYHPRGLVFDICVYICGRWYFLSWLGFWVFFPQLKFFLEWLNMSVCVPTFTWESVCWGRVVIKYKGILYGNIKIHMSYIFALQTQKPVSAVSLGLEGTRQNLF